ncbi:FAD-dependent monooxygenase [Luteibacter yeojuensis]|uniref:FAD-binding domain-containing protein n=1 Tax=Luteibacter yeojuensis TaxID=345309 RepID=A0A0F3KX18_9GAMM|nr:FAD-dependent monooxygenase [Luteibacter yeojuensis]KJV35696.1 hypothetical protein VI08_06740 [Luteibacter yeojuensis]
MIETDVLIAGCGPAGLTAALALARRGVRVMAVTKHRQLSPTPRAHVTNQRTFEILREFGLEAEALALATPYATMPDALFMRSLAGEEYARIRGLGEDASAAANATASPCLLADLPQHLFEPLLYRAAIAQGAIVRFGTQLDAFTQDEDGVTAHLHDRLGAGAVDVRARYLIGADGGRSTVAAALGLPFEGPGDIGTSLNILFHADLAPYVAHRPGVLYFMLGDDMSILRCIKPWSSWMMIKGYAPGHATPSLSPDEAAHVVRDALGLPGLDLDITGVDPWTMNAAWSPVYQQGRVFCMGDAVHRHVPSNGLGSNTAVQDAYNLAWKLDLVLCGLAGPALLDTYSTERAPIGRAVVERATESLASYGPLVELDVNALPEPGDTGHACRRELHEVMKVKHYEFRARGFELNQVYHSAAVLESESAPAMEEGDDVDRELEHVPTTRPGARVPHAWVQHQGKALSTLDLVGRGRFTVLTGVGGAAWIAGAGIAAARLGLDVPAFAIGPGCEVEDLYFEWAERREIRDDGCLLVRPDGYIGWRSHALGTLNAADCLLRALAAILAR